MFDVKHQNPNREIFVGKQYYSQFSRSTLFKAEYAIAESPLKTLL